jgi:hypothetical protein
LPGPNLLGARPLPKCYFFTHPSSICCCRRGHRRPWRGRSWLHATSRGKHATNGARTPKHGAWHNALTLPLSTYRTRASSLLPSTQHHLWCSPALHVPLVRPGPVCPSGEAPPSARPHVVGTIHRSRLCLLATPHREKKKERGRRKRQGEE